MTPAPIAVAPLDRPRSLNIIGEQVTVLASGEQTGSFELFFQSGPENVGPPPHSHPWDEAFYVLRGEVVFWVGAEEQVAGAGTVVFVPGGTLHSFRLGAGGAEMLSVTSEAGASAMFAEIDEKVPPGPPDVASLMALADAHRLTIALPPVLDGVTALERAHAHLVKTVEALAPDQLGQASGCSEWDVRALLNHVLGVASMFTLVNQGELVGEDGGDLAGDDPAAACARIAAANLASWRGPAALGGERAYWFGTFPAPTALLLNVGEIAVHGWDLAKTTGQDATIDPEVAELLIDFYSGMPMDLFRANGAFGPAVEVDPAAPAGDRLVALLGFRP